MDKSLAAMTACGPATAMYTGKKYDEEVKGIFEAEIRNGRARPLYVAEFGNGEILDTKMKFGVGAKPDFVKFVKGTEDVDTVYDFSTSEKWGREETYNITQLHFAYTYARLNWGSFDKSLGEDLVMTRRHYEAGKDVYDIVRDRLVPLGVQTMLGIARGAAAVDILGPAANDVFVFQSPGGAGMPPALSSMATTSQAINSAKITDYESWAALLYARSESGAFAPFWFEKLLQVLAYCDATDARWLEYMRKFGDDATASFHINAIRFLDDRERLLTNHLYPRIVVANKIVKAVAPVFGYSPDIVRTLIHFEISTTGMLNGTKCARCPYYTANACPGLPPPTYIGDEKSDIDEAVIRSQIPTHQIVAMYEVMPATVGFSNWATHYVGWFLSNCPRRQIGSDLATEKRLSSAAAVRRLVECRIFRNGMSFVDLWNSDRRDLMRYTLARMLAAPLVDETFSGVANAVGGRRRDAVKLNIGNLADGRAISGFSPRSTAALSAIAYDPTSPSYCSGYVDRVVTYELGRRDLPNWTLMEDTL
ncbi:MAG: hypothetical protein M0R66_03905 [Candidatus Omnitrophica bacterium]|nr:hypothetical protein [Candidatus Omnitrophota bacterium]